MYNPLGKLFSFNRSRSNAGGANPAVGAGLATGSSSGGSGASSPASSGPTEPIGPEVRDEWEEPILPAVYETADAAWGYGGVVYGSPWARVHEGGQGGSLITTSSRGNVNAAALVEYAHNYGTGGYNLVKLSGIKDQLSTDWAMIDVAGSWPLVCSYITPAYGDPYIAFTDQSIWDTTLYGFTAPNGWVSKNGSIVLVMTDADIALDFGYKELNGGTEGIRIVMDLGGVDVYVMGVKVAEYTTAPPLLNHFTVIVSIDAGGNAAGSATATLKLYIDGVEEDSAVVDSRHGAVAMDEVRFGGTRMGTIQTFSTVLTSDERDDF